MGGQPPTQIAKGRGCFRRHVELQRNASDSKFVRGSLQREQVIQRKPIEQRDYLYFH